MSLLVICPTKGRPELCQQMLKSFMATKSQDTHIIFTLEDDDPKWQDYKNLFGLYNVNYFECPPKNMTAHINDMFSAFPDYDFYMIANDDITFHTPGWDKILTSKPGINHGDDGLQGKFLTTFPVVSANIAKALGWLQCPMVERYYGDTALTYLGNMCGCKNYFPEVSIEHLHYLNNKREADGNDAPIDPDAINYGKWLSTQSQSDIRKVREVLCQQ